VLYFRTNDAGGGLFYFRTSVAPDVGFSGVTDAESVTSATAIGYSIITFASPFNFGVGSLFAPFRFSGTPINGDTFRWPNTSGLQVLSDGTLSADSNNIDVVGYYNNGGSDIPVHLIIDNSSIVVATSVNDAESVPFISATGSVAGNAGILGVNESESVPSESATGGAKAQPSGVTDSESVPSSTAAAGAAASVQAPVDAESVAPVAARGDSTVSPAGVNDAESVPSATPAAGVAVSIAGTSDVESVPTESVAAGAAPQPLGITDAESVPSAQAQIGAEVRGVDDVEQVPSQSATGDASIIANGVNDTESVPRVVAAEVPESTYAQSTHMINRFGSVEIIQLTDKENVGSINASVLSQALADTDAEIDGYLEGRYSLPLQIVPRILTTYACDIARYRLYDDRATEQVSKRYDAAIKFLSMIAQRKINLGLDEESEDKAPSTGGPSASSSTRTFTDDSLKDFKGPI
jgi:phage gp36-like protein